MRLPPYAPVGSDTLRQSFLSYVALVLEFDTAQLPGLDADKDPQRDRRCPGGLAG